MSATEITTTHMGREFKRFSAKVLRDEVLMTIVCLSCAWGETTCAELTDPFKFCPGCGRRIERVEQDRGARTSLAAL